MSYDGIKTIVDSILEADDSMVCIPLKDLIWTIVSYSYDMRNYENEAFESKFIGRNEVESLIELREYKACRRDELARLISKYTGFDTHRIWKEVDLIFKDYGK